MFDAEEAGAEAQEQSSGTEEQQTQEDFSFLDDIDFDLGQVNDYGAEHGQGFVTEEDAKTTDEDNDKEEKEDKTDEKKPEKKAGEEEETHEAKWVKDLRRKNRELTKRIKELETSSVKGGKEESAEKDTALTDEQILAIMKEHRDDEQVLFNVMKYINQRGAKDAQKAAEAVSIQKEIKGQVDAYVSETLFKAFDPDEVEDELEKQVPAAKWGLENHPLEKQIRQLILMGANVKGIVANQVKKALAQHSQKQASTEKARVEAIKKGKPIPENKSGSAASPELDAKASRIAREIGLSKSGQAIYMGLLKKKGA